MSMTQHVLNHNGNIVTRMYVKDIVRIYCLNNQSHEETKIRHMTLTQLKTKSFIKFSPQTETLKLDAIYFYCHDLDEGSYKLT